MQNYRRDFFRLVEAALVGLFFVQAVRFLYGTLYAHVSSAGLVRLTADPAALLNQLGVVRPDDVEVELLVVGAALLAPLLSVVLGRLSFGPALAAIACAAGRVLLTANGGTTFGVMGAAITAGAGALYFTLLAVRRPAMLPAFFVLGFAGDQLVRLFGNTMDLTWAAAFLEAQTAISLALFAAAVLALALEYIGRRQETPPVRGQIGIGGAIALGGLLFLQFAGLGLPNLVARHAGMDYTAAAPALLIATLLPLVAEIRRVARNFLAMFDGRYRGPVWFLTIALLLIIGYRFDGPVALGALIIAQFLISLTWWWVGSPTDERRSLTGLAVILGVLVFLLLTGADFFTFEYAFVRGLQEPFGAILRALRGLGLIVTIGAALLACLPTVFARKRLPWRGAPGIESLAALALLVGAGVIASSLVRPVPMQPPVAPTILRIATLNLHGGYSLYFGSDLADVAAQIRANGVDVLLLQDVEAGRLVSFGVDQPAWLARELNMQVAYFPTNEDVQGMAVLSRLPIETESGLLLTSLSKQTGAQFVRVRAQDGSLLDVYNTQLTLLFRGGFLSLEEQEQDQARQIQEVIDWSRQNGSLEGRTILGGTFNHAPGAEIYVFLTQQGFSDPFVDFPVERAITRRAVNEPPVRVDYLWLRNIRARFVGVAPIAASNHNMAIVEINIP